MLQKAGEHSAEDLLPSIDVPVLIIAGSEDPLNEAVLGLRILVKRWRDAGSKKIDQHYYQGARHELLNELNRQQVMEQTVAWLLAQLDRGVS